MSLQGRNIRTSSLPTLVSVSTQDPNTVASLVVTFPDDDSLVPIIRRTQDDLPPHVKGTAIWLPRGISGKGYYIPQELTTSNNNEPVEFINNQWFGLFFHQRTLSTRQSLAIAFENSFNLGWWAPTDPRNHLHALHPVAPFVHHRT